MFKDICISPCDDYYDCKNCENSTILDTIEIHLENLGETFVHY